MEINTTITMPFTMSPVAISPSSWLPASAHHADPASTGARVRTFAGNAKQDRPPRGVPH
ncbi:MAG: hypothetical protein ABI232_06855 [Jatrophihabitantaceae bacterium]